jgi:hypothetical protein
MSQPPRPPPSGKNAEQQQQQQQGVDDSPPLPYAKALAAPISHDAAVVGIASHAHDINGHSDF